MRRGNRIRLMLFTLVAVVSVVFAGLKYVGIGERYLGQTYVISVSLPDSGGIFPNAEVTERGVEVGRVESLELTPDGVRADLRIHNEIEIPTNTLVKVSDLSAVGEQYINLVPQTDDGPYLADGQALPVSAATIPVQVTEVLVHLNQVARSIGVPQLRTFVTELGRSLDGAGGDLQTVLDETQHLTRELTAVQSQTTELLSDSGNVLRTQVELRPSLEEFSTSLDQLTKALAQADPDIRRILDAGPSTLRDVAEFLQQNRADVGVLLGNLLSTAEIAAAPERLQGQNDLLVVLPLVIQQTFNAQPGDGYTRLGVVLSTTQRVCTTGYESSGVSPPQQANPSAVPGDPSRRANVNAYCALPPESGIDVRGGANAVRPPGDTTATPAPQGNPRGYGPGSSFANAGPPDPDTTDPASTTPTAYGEVRVLGPSDLRGLLIKDLG